MRSFLIPPLDKRFILINYFLINLITTIKLLLRRSVQVHNFYGAISEPLNLSGAKIRGKE